MKTKSFNISISVTFHSEVTVTKDGHDRRYDSATIHITVPIGHPWFKFKPAKGIRVFRIDTLNMTIPKDDVHFVKDNLGKHSYHLTFRQPHGQFGYDWFRDVYGYMGKLHTASIKSYANQISNDLMEEYQKSVEPLFEIHDATIDLSAPRVIHVPKKGYFVQYECPICHENHFPLEGC